jgi:hypothetical protein
VTKDTISIWQRATIRDALPEEYKEKAKVEYGKLGRQEQLEQGSGQVSEYADSGENGNIQPDSTRAESDSSGEKGQYSEDFNKVNRGHDVITQTERIKKLENRLNEQEIELDIVKKQNLALKEKDLPELFKEIQERFYDQPGILDAKKLNKINVESGRNLRIMLDRCNGILQDIVAKGEPVPVGTYIITKPDMKLGSY